ncbi:MAG TPA: GNAT family N-acetyltransferase [Candidatus Eisenbergiella merdipullorum]|uniref:GNAT family N-acetyltransferase n=1 Tax=Candidatus Eisenbergiella merdipullorum TaxID=2838553 RepID=A0A9D2I6L2_9FIRM|nr:GNAT family N-acetyltransferase [Candidatus Eisenbergiella merdipullorum]
MRYETKKIILKNGQEVVFRSPSTSEGAQMMEFLKQLAAETEFILRYPEECRETAQQEAEYLGRMIQSPTDLMIVCTVDGEIAGNCQISFTDRIKTRHRATLAIGILQKFWGLGIGTAMFSEMERAAGEKGVLQMELDYIEGNERGRRLYEKMGFVPVAERPDAIRLKDGTMRKEISMIKKL